LKENLSIKGHGLVEQVKISIDGRYMVAVEGDYKINIWNFKKERLI